MLITTFTGSELRIGINLKEMFQYTIVELCVNECSIFSYAYTVDRRFYAARKQCVSVIVSYN